MSNPSVPQVAPSYNSPDQIRIISRRRPPWAWFDKRIITCYGRQLGPHGIAVYMALAVHADGESQTCFPSYQTIAREIGVSKPTVLKAIKLLLSLLLISKQAMQSPEGDAGPNLYALLDILVIPLTLSPPAVDRAPEAHPAVAEGGVVNDVDYPSKPPLPPVVNDVSPNKNLCERDEKNEGNSPHLHVERGNSEQPPRFGSRGYTPLTRDQLAERKAFLRQQAAQLCEQDARRDVHSP